MVLIAVLLTPCLHSHKSNLCGGGGGGGGGGGNVDAADWSSREDGRKCCLLQVAVADFAPRELARTIQLTPDSTSPLDKIDNNITSWKPCWELTVRYS